MKTTLEIPDSLFRKTKAAAAMRGVPLKTLIIEAVEKEISGEALKETETVQLPLVRMKSGRALDLTGFDFDDLLT